MSSVRGDRLRSASSISRMPAMWEMENAAGEKRGDPGA